MKKTETKKKSLEDFKKDSVRKTDTLSYVKIKGTGSGDPWPPPPPYNAQS